MRGVFSAYIVVNVSNDDQKVRQTLLILNCCLQYNLLIETFSEQGGWHVQLSEITVCVHSS